MSATEFSNCGHSPYAIRTTSNVRVLSPPGTDLMISTSDVDTYDEQCPVTALTTTSSAVYFDTTDKPLADSSCLAVEGHSLFVLEQAQGKNLLSVPNPVSHAGTQCALENSGSDVSENTEAEAVQHEAFLHRWQNGFSGEELTKKERRRAQNRRAAQRCRARRKIREAALVKEMEKEMVTMRCLETELHRLASEKRELEMTLIQHGVFAPFTTDDSHTKPEENDMLLPGFYFQ